MPMNKVLRIYLRNEIQGSFISQLICIHFINAMISRYSELDMCDVFLALSILIEDSGTLGTLG